MFPSDSVPPLSMKTELLDMDFSPEVDFRKRRRNRTTQSCLNCHTSKRKASDVHALLQLYPDSLSSAIGKDPANVVFSWALPAFASMKSTIQHLGKLVQINATSWSNKLPEMTPTWTRQRDCGIALRSSKALYVSCVMCGKWLNEDGSAIGKPHPRWADQTYYDGDSADKWHTRSQRRTNGIVRPRRMLTPPAEHASLIKAEPMGDAQHTNCYYRLSPSPPPLSANTTSSYSLTIGHAGQGHYAANGYSMQMGTGGNAINGSSPATYSPSSASNSSGGIQGRPSHPYAYEDTCSCVADPAANHSFIALARQLEAMTNYLQQLPSHSQATCEISRRIQDLKSILHGDNVTKIPAASSATVYGGGSYEAHHTDSVRSPVESDLLTPLSLSSSVGISAPATPHGFHSLQWGTEGANHHNPHSAAYFSASEMYAKQAGAYDVSA